MENITGTDRVYLQLVQNTWHIIKSSYLMAS